MITGTTIQAFWEKLKPDTREVLLTGNPIVFVGNGVSRLARSEYPLLSWEGWVRDCWKEIQPKVPFDYAMLRGLSLPECISYLKESVENEDGVTYAGVTRKKEKIYRTLWNVFEKNAQPSDLHYTVVERFNTVLTTNYDTLIERAAKDRSYKTDVIVLGAKGARAEPHVSFGEERPRKLIIKLHGSFPVKWLARYREPLEDVFQAWYEKYEGENLIASIRGYRAREPHTQRIATEVAKPLVGRPIVVLGYGMDPEDDLVIFLLSYIAPSAKITMTYGGDEIDAHRYKNQWRLQHLSLPGKQGGGAEARANAHIQFIDQITTGSCKESKFEENRALLIGQSGVNFVFRLETAPLQERAYSVITGEFHPHDTRQEIYESRQVGGQMLVPATFLNRWGVPVSFASVIGYDEYGAQIRRHLQRLENIDWRHVKMDPSVRTDHSYAITFEEVRTIVDCGSSMSYPQAVERFTHDLLYDLNSGLLSPRVIYLSKWFFKSCAPALQEWFEKKPDERPLVAYETGGWGSKDPRVEERRVVGSFCDVVLSSSLFAMRASKLPLWSDKDEMIGYSPTDDVSLSEWEEQLLQFQPQNATNRSYQNLAFVRAAMTVGREGLHERLFDGVFPNASWWVVTLGNGGMVAFKRDQPDQDRWIPAPQVTVRNALGCGDVGRAAFIGWYMKSTCGRTEFLDSTESVVAAVKLAVAAGSYKAEYFSLGDAVEFLPWETLTEKALELSVHRFWDDKTFDVLINILTGPNEDDVDSVVD